MTTENQRRPTPDRGVAPMAWAVLMLTTWLGLSACGDDAGEGASPGPASRPAPAEAESLYNSIAIHGQHGWRLVIQPSGSALYSFGAGGPAFSSDPIRPGTFDFRAVVARAQRVSLARNLSNPGGLPQWQREADWYSVSLWRPGVSVAEMRDTRDASFVKGLFEKAMVAAPPGPELAKVLRTRPPFPADAATKPVGAMPKD